MSSWTRHPFLVIAGTSKAATTSLFGYLADHPDISGSSEKETRFFLDSDYPLESSSRFERSGIQHYGSFFSLGSEVRFHLEATPDYLYSKNTARWLAQSIGDLRLVFILREPVDRLISWHRFGQAMNAMPRMDFDQYVALQLEQEGKSYAEQPHPCYMALEHGRYSVFLRPFFESLPSQRIFVGFYEELAADPRRFLVKLCDFLEIESSPYQEYNFQVVNKGVDVRNAFVHRSYVDLKQGLRASLERFPPVKRTLRLLRPAADQLYEALNARWREQPVMSSATENLLKQYYSGEPSQLQALVGLTPSWWTE